MVATIFKIIAKKGVTVQEFCFTRAFAGMLCCAVYLGYKRMNPITNMPREHMTTIILRGICGVTVFAAFKYCLTLIPHALVVILVQTNIFWVSVLAYFLLKERIRWYEYISMPVCFLGVLMIVMNKASPSAIAEFDPTQRLFGIILALITAWGMAGLFILNRKLSNVNPVLVMFCHSIVGLVGAGIFNLIEALIRGGLRTHSQSNYALLALISFLDFGQVIAQVIAFQSDSPTFISLLG
jgi:drug/metabolite transporter (DMT)-like permease